VDCEQKILKIDLSFAGRSARQRIRGARSADRDAIPADSPDLGARCGRWIQACVRSAVARLRHAPAAGLPLQDSNNLQ
jgi:hypothetical protein